MQEPFLLSVYLLLCVLAPPLSSKLVRVSRMLPEWATAGLIDAVLFNQQATMLIEKECIHRTVWCTDRVQITRCKKVAEIALVYLQCCMHPFALLPCGHCKNTPARKQVPLVHFQHAVSELWQDRADTPS